MRWTRAARLTGDAGCGRRSRVVLMPRRWHQVGEKQFSPATVANKPGHRGEREVTVKTIARGMPGDSGVTVVTNARAIYHTTRGCGRIGARHSLLPLGAALRPCDLGGTSFMVNLARSRGEIAKLWLQMRLFESSRFDLFRVRLKKGSIK
jgi:hypothetical protein